jgi:hypothetical protein
MSELRWILLLAGLVFMAVLTVLELRRPRQGRGTGLIRPERNEPVYAPVDDDMDIPTATLLPAQLSVPAPAPVYHDEARDARQPLMTPVQIELPPLEALELLEPAELVVYQPLPDLLPEVDEEPASPLHPIESAVPEPLHDPEPLLDPEPWLDPTGEPGVRSTDEPDELSPMETSLLAAGVESHQARDVSEPVAAELDSQFVPEVHPPIVDLPQEQIRQVLSVRVMGISPDLMPGRPLRQALAACGFAHGRFGIFHQPGADGRALISAANLSKPGHFDPANMDFQRFRGVGLFAVLPGPLPPAAALDHLLDTAGDLAQRLQARLYDEHGKPLDEERLESMARIVQSMTDGALRTEPAA